MRTAIAAIVIGIWPLQGALLADEDVASETKQDVVLRALVDELERGKVGLKLEDLARPYFIEYGLVDVAGAWVSATLGTVTRSNEMRSRNLRTDLRVGSYELDNTNFRDGYGGSYFGGGFGGVAIPIEDDYYAIRQAIWWASDRGYKNAVETFEKKKAFMETKLIEDKPEDFSRQAPAIYFEELAAPVVKVGRLKEMAIALSAIFREYPAVQSSGVNLGGGSGNKYLVNSEGTRLRTSRARFTLSVNATVQADDGMKLSDSFSVQGREFEELGAVDELKQRCHQMAERLIKLKDAPILESYTGPVLFDAEPAASIFSSQFANRFTGGQRQVGSRTSPDDFEKKLKKRILPRFVSVVDDPTQKTIAGKPVMGHYLYDDQGVKARPVTLVEQGRLQALVMSRNPSKEFKESTGHGRGAYRLRASIGCLIVTATDGAEAASLRQKLLEACQDEDLEYGIRIAALGSTGDGGRYGRYAGYAGAFDPRGGSTPLAIYKVYPDGREELVRGAQIARFDLKAFKRILAAGDEPYVLNRGGRSGGRTVVAPAMLFEELDLADIDQDFDKPPILTGPLARASHE